MRSVAFVIALAAAASALAQPTSSYRITHTYTLGGEGRWDYIVPDPANHRLFIARQNRVMVVDEGSGKLLGEITSVDGAGFDAASGDAFASNADGTLTVIHQDSADHYHVTQTIQTPQGSRNMGLDPTNHRLFVACAKFGPAPGGKGRGPVLPGSFALLVIERE